MLNNSVRNKNRELPKPYEGGEKERVLGAYRDRVEKISVLRHFRSPDGETCGVEITDSPVGLKQMALQSNETQLLSSSDQICRITDQAQLKTIFSGRAGNLLLERGETSRLNSAIRINEYQHRPS